MNYPDLADFIGAEMNVRYISLELKLILNTCTESEIAEYLAIKGTPAFKEHQAIADALARQDLRKTYPHLYK